MKLNIPFIEKNIELNKNYFYSIIYENIEDYRNFLDHLVQCIEGEEEFISLYKDEDKLEISKSIYFVESLYNLELDDKKIQNYVYKDINKYLSQDKKIEFQELNNQIIEYIRSVTYDYKVPLDLDEEIDLPSLFKVYSLKVEEDKSNYLTMIINKIKCISLLFNINVFVLNNIHLYLSSEEISLFFKEMNRLEIYIINITAFRSDFNEYERAILIDNDKCEIYLNFNEDLC